MTGPKALLFDVFGTVVDWRSSVSAELESAFAPEGASEDWDALADAWRALYQPAMERVRGGERGFAVLDVLHRENLDRLIAERNLPDLAGDARERLARAWHRLRPWPDAPGGLARLRGRRIVATLSNGNVALMVNLSRFAGLGWDAILGAEATRSYKPAPETYLGSAAALGLAPGECMMVAAHNPDLAAAAALGFRTAFVRRPAEHGPGQASDLAPEGDWDVACDDFHALAEALDGMDPP